MVPQPVCIFIETLSNCFMERVKISVVIPTYKRPSLLMRCINALFDQSFASSEFEIIVISDGEDNETLALVASLSSRRYPALGYYSLPVKSGPAAARNLGWTIAKAKLILFTDDDCIPSANWLEAMWNAFKSSRMSKVAFSGRTVVPINSHPTDYEKNIARLATAEFITANCGATRMALECVGGFDERFRMAWREDSDLQFKFIVGGIPLVKVPAAIVTHPVRKAPWGISIREERKGMFNALLYKKYPRLYREKIGQKVPWHYYAIVILLVLFIVGVITGSWTLKVIGLAGWAGFTLWFAGIRLRSTSRSINHISEMVVTSALIPVLSLFWRYYGRWKFRGFRTH